MRTIALKINGQPYVVQVGDADPISREVTVQVNGRQYLVELTGDSGGELPDPVQPRARPTQTPAPVASGRGQVTASMPGLVNEIHVEEGAVVEEGATFLIMEAMKMQISIVCENTCRVRRILVQPGDRVKTNQLLLEYEALEG